MKKILLTGLVGEKANHEGLRELLHKNTPRLQRYCDVHGFELRILREPAPAGAGRHSGHPVWIKFGHYKETLQYELDDGDCVVWVDSDVVLVRADYDLTPKHNFVFSTEPRGTLNAGIMGWRKCAFSTRLISSVWNMLDEDILPGFPAGWVDQSGIITFLERLSVMEAFINVGFYPPYVNGTGKCELMPKEIYRKLVFRHFAGNLPIEWAWFNRPLAGDK